MSGLERQSKYWPVTLSGEDYWSISWPWTDADWNQRRLLIWEFSKCSRINIHCCEMCLGATHLFHKYNTLVLLCIQSKIWDEKAQMIVIYSLSVLFLFPFSLINFVTKFAICIESCFFYRLFGLKIEDSLVYHDCFSTAKLEDKDKNFANCIYCPLMLCWICTFVTDKEMDSL